MNRHFLTFVLNMGLCMKPQHLIRPQSNGVVERKNRTLKEMMNAMLISFGLPQNMWGETILFVNYLLNEVRKKKVEKTPYELWRGR